MHEIFNYFISKDDGNDQRRVGFLYWFCPHFPQSEFRREEAVFRDFMEYCYKLGVPLKEKYFEVYLSSELRKFIVETNTKIDGTETFNYSEPNALETALQTIKETMLLIFRDAEANPCDIVDFPVSAQQFIANRLNERTVEVFSKAYENISTKGDSLEPVEAAREQLGMLADIYDPAVLEEIVDMPDDGGSMQFLCNTGIPAIDSDIGGLYRGQLGDISGGPGAGKTRFTLGVWVHRAAVNFNLNVVFYALEQKKFEIEAMLVARHMFHLYEIQLADKYIKANEIPEDLRPKYEAAKLDLFESGKYGKIEIIETDLYVEDFISRIRSVDKNKGPFDVIVIDNMPLIQQKPAKYSKALQDYQVVQRAYRIFKKYVRNHNKGGISVNQFTREGVKASKNDKEIDQTMGAGGMETFRSTDFNLTISYDEAMRAQFKRRISMPKTRSSEGIGSVIVDTRPGICLFYQMNKKKL